MASPGLPSDPQPVSVFSGPELPYDDGPLSDDEALSVFEKIVQKVVKFREKETKAKNDAERTAEQRQHVKRLVTEDCDRLVTATTFRDQNFLHFLASTATTHASKGSVVLQLTARMLVQRGGVEMLVQVDDSGHTPLNKAIQGNNRYIINALSERGSMSSTIEKARQAIEQHQDVRDSHPTKSTFLHDAMASKGLRKDTALLLFLISLAPDAMLSAVDAKGRTPLHLAVDYAKCGAARLDIIRALISRKPKVLEVRDEQNRSVYQYHVMSNPARHNGSEVNVRAGRAASPVPSVASSSMTSVTDEEEKAIKDELMLESLRVMSCKVAHRCLQLPNENDKELWFDYLPAPSTDMTFDEFKGHWKLLNFESTLKYVSIANIEFKPERGAKPAARQRRDDATRVFDWLLNSKGVQRILHVIVDDMSSSNHHSNESIEQALRKAKVEVLEWRRPDLCPSTVFQIGSHLREVHLYWGGNNAVLRAWSEVEGLPMLARYDQLRRIVIVWPEDSPDLPSRPSKVKESFNARLKSNWLLAAKSNRSKSKSASRSSLGSPAGKSHRQANEKAPKDETGPSASQPRDQGPGQQPVDSPKSSQKLPEQEKVTPPKVYHTTAVKPKVGSAGGEQQGEMDQHRWMQCMEDYTTAFQRVRQPSTRDSAANMSLKPIEVALIDDGVDTTDKSLRGKSYYGRSFAFHDEGGRAYPYWISDSNHGTSMARFIRKICPTADIYVIKVATRRGTKNSSRLTIDVSSAIDAINHAVDRGAKIISMSWSVKPPAEEDLRTRFDEAIQRAVRNKTIMICASSDQGQTGKDETYPYDSNRANMIRIGAATATGNTPAYVDKEQVDFLFPGHDILLKGGSTPEKELGDVHKGSSVATAIAAGLAAMVLECVRIGHYWTTKNDKSGSVVMVTEEDLKMDSKAVKEAFDGMGRSKSPYIWVWETFTPEVCEDITDGGSHEQWEIVARLANRFLNR